MQIKNFLLAELQEDALTEGQAFDGFVDGDFVDMHGRRIIVEADELEDYVENTAAAIEATRQESGDIWGLPIDTFDHDKQSAAGWIIGVSLSDGIVRFIPRWTKLGKELIEDGIRKFFSATFNTDSQVILGGTLTNWPATRDEDGKHLLRPIELSESAGTTQGIRNKFWTYDLADEISIEEKIDQIRFAFSEQFPNHDNRPFMWVQESFDDFVIVEEGADHFRVGYSEDDGAFVFDTTEEWVRVNSKWVDAAKAAARKILLSGPIGRVSAALGRSARKKKKSEDSKMGNKIELDDLSTEERNELALGLFAELAGSDHESADLGERFSTLVDQRAKSQVEKQTAIADREKGIAEFSSEITGGTDEFPVGVPLTEDEILAFLSMLTDEAALAEAKRIFGKIQSEGLVAFTENGHGRRVEGNQELPDEYAKKLDSGALKIEDLSDPVLDLGDLSAYDLSKWKDQKVEA